MTPQAQERFAYDLETLPLRQAMLRAMLRDPRTQETWLLRRELAENERRIALAKDALGRR